MAEPIRLQCPNGNDVYGTVDTIPAVTFVNVYKMPDGSIDIEHTGGYEDFHDGMQGVCRTPPGGTEPEQVFQDRRGNEFLLSELVPVGTPPFTRVPSLNPAQYCPTVERSAAALLQEMVERWTVLDTEESVSGADMVDWLSDYRRRAQELLTPCTAPPIPERGFQNNGGCVLVE